MQSLENAMKQESQFVFIMGPHRSGSSLVAGALHSMGVNLGNRYIEPNDDNPKGFFEDEDIVRFNDRLLRSLNLSWDSFGFIWEQDFSSARLKPYHATAVAMVSARFATTKLAGLKDPRFCILLPFWKSVISEALDVQVRYVLSIRQPDHCVRSQRTRHLKDSDFHVLGRRSAHTMLLWWTYLTKALSYIDPDHLVIVDYTAMIDAPERGLQKLAGLLDVELSQKEIDSFCGHHVEPLLNRSKHAEAMKLPQRPLLWRYSNTLYERLLNLSKKDTITAEEIVGAFEELDTKELQPLYLQEMQFLNGYSYKKIISLRHRLIQTIHEVASERQKFTELCKDYDELLEKHRILGDQHRILEEQYRDLGDQHNALVFAYEAINANLQMLLNSRGWRVLTAIRRYIRSPFR